MKAALSIVALVLMTSGATTPIVPGRASGAGHSQAAPKVLVYVDMDGSSGVSRARQVLYPNPEYFASRKFITSDLNAVIRGLKAGGAGEIVVTDAHGSGNAESPDVLVEQMDKRATFLYRDTEYDPYIDALDSSYQAIVAVGMHAKAQTNGFMAHTVTVEPLYVVNGRRISESALIAISAARFGIPVIMIAGDDVLQEQIREEFPQAEYAVVKRARGRANADLVPQPEVQAGIERAAKAAIEKVASFRPYEVAPEYRFEMGYQNTRQADLAGSIPGTTRRDSLTLTYTTKTFPEGYALSLRMNRMARMDGMRWLLAAVQARPDAKEIMGEYVDLLIRNWLEPETIGKANASAPKEAAKRRYYGDT